MNRLIIISILCLFSVSAFSQSQARVPKWEKFVRINGTNVNLRLSPGLDGEKFMVKGADGASTSFFYPKGEIVPVLGENAEWVKVYCPESPKGFVWVFKKYAQTVMPKALPAEHQHYSYLSYGYSMLTYNFDDQLKTFCFDGSYPFGTKYIDVDTPLNYVGNEWKFLSADGFADWDKVMPEIVQSFPIGYLAPYAKGEQMGEITTNFKNPGKNNIEEGFYKKNRYVYSAYWSDVHYTIKIVACPLRDTDEVLLIAMSFSGLDGMCLDKLRTMRYNLTTKTYSEASSTIPGIQTDVLGLTFDFVDCLNNPELKKQIREDEQRDLNISDCQGVPMVEVSFGNVDLQYALFEAESPDGFWEKMTVFYLWDGRTFCKMMRCPYEELVEKQIGEYYAEYAAQREDSSFPANFNDHRHLADYFYQLLEKADRAQEKADEKWCNEDIWTFGSRDEKFTVSSVECFNAQTSGKARVNLSNTSVLLDIVYNQDTYQYEIRDFIHENGSLSIYRRAKDFVNAHQ